MPKTYKLLEVKDLNTSFKIDAGRVLAVNGVSFNLEQGKVLGIVGESGSGKSVTAYSIMRILDKNGKIDSGKIIYKGTDLLKLSEKEMREVRGNKISIIFQDAMTSLNPTWSIGNQLREAILIHSADPIKKATYSLENEVKSDKQRIASMEKGLAHHPDNKELKSDLEFVKNKLVTDEKNYKDALVKAKEDLKKNEAAAKKEYKEHRPEYNKKIHEARVTYWKKYFKLNKAPSKELLIERNAYKAQIAKIVATNASLKKAEKFLEAAKEEYRESRKSQDKKVTRWGHFKKMRSTKKALHLAKKEYKKALNENRRYVNKFNHRFIIKPRTDRKNVLLTAKKAKHDYYWDLRSKYRETKYSAGKKALAMLNEVGITEPEKRMKQYPFELSGGMLQRCMIAMALVQRPDILIADEPTTALDVTIQAQILELLKKLQKEYGMAVLIITHDLGVVAQVCDEVDIMYAGRVVERGTVDDIFYHPQHEYTKGLLKSMPKLNQPKGLLDPIKGNPVDLFCLPKGCAFSSRCKDCMRICIDKYPEEVSYNAHHAASCWAMVKRLNEAKKINIMGKPTGKPLVYNGAIISNVKKTRKEKKADKKAKLNEGKKDEKGEQKK